MKPFRHVDVLAICLVLAGVAIVSQVRQSPVFAYQSAKFAEFTNRRIAPILSNPFAFKFCVTRD